MLNKLKPFLLWGGLFMPFFLILSFIPYGEDVSLVWLNLVFWLVAVFYFADRFGFVCFRR